MLTKKVGITYHNQNQFDHAIWIEYRLFGILLYRKSTEVISNDRFRSTQLTDFLA